MTQPDDLSVLGAPPIGGAVDLAEMARARAEEVHVSHARSIVGLVYALSRKNFQVRYKRAMLGVAWAVLQPVVQAAVLAFVFTKLIHIDRVPNYPLFVLAGVLPWSYLTQSMSAATTSVVDNGPLVRKVALPLSVFPISAVGGTAIAYVASIGVLVVVAVLSGNVGFALLYLPLAIALETALIVGFGVFTSAFHVAFRDVRYLVDSFLLLAFYATPILYDQSALKQQTYRRILRANPMTGVMSLYRAAVLQRPVDWAAVAVTLVFVPVLAVVAATVFHRRADEFADLV
jgi:ABC-2 type transport system permease protein/lipopolysaccharide transport system permease protein